MKVVTIHIHALLLVLIAAAAGASRPALANPVLRPLADTEVRQISSVQRRNVLLRAVVGMRGEFPYLAIEILRPDPGDGGPPQLQQQQYVNWVQLGGQLITLRTLRVIENLRWQKRALWFDTYIDGTHSQCKVPTRGRNAFTGRCSSHASLPPPPPPPPPPLPPPAPEPINWAGRPQVIQACGNAFTGSANESACLQVVAGAAYNPTAIIATCDEFMFGDKNTLACLRTAVRADRNPTRRLRACEDAMTGNDNELACFRVAVRAQYDMASVIGACEYAMTGDDNALQCIQVAAGALGDISNTVRACDDAMSGDNATLACIRRSIAP